MSDCPRLPFGLTIRELVDTYLLHTSHQCFPVVNNENVMGIITVQNIKEIPRDRWESLTVSEVMMPLKEMISVHPDEEVFSAMQKMSVARVSQLPVVENDQIIGMISRDSLMNIINLRTDLKV